MEDKLQGLLEKIYQEGVSKGQEVGAAIVSDAEKKAEKIITEAEREAAEIRKQAREDADELKRNVVSELRLSADQAIDALKQKITNLISAKAISEPLHDAFSDEDFLKSIIKTLIENWRPGQNGQAGVRLLLPGEKEEQLDQYFSAKAREALDGKVEIQLDHRIENGFRIGPADGHYVISFSEKDFEVFFMDFLRPRTKALLYGESP